MEVEVEVVLVGVSWVVDLSDGVAGCTASGLHVGLLYYTFGSLSCYR